MKRATLDERKRFAAELAQRDAARDADRRARLEAACVDEPHQVALVERLMDEPRLPPPYSDTLEVRLRAEQHLAYKMRRWWLDRYTLDEIRDLGSGLVHLTLERAA